MRCHAPVLALCAALAVLSAGTRGADTIRAEQVYATPGQTSVSVPIHACHDDAALVGFSLGIAYSANALKVVDFRTAGTAIEKLPLDFFSENHQPGNGYSTLSASFNFGPGPSTIFLGPSRDDVIIIAVVDVLPSASVGDVATLDLADGLGSPPVRLFLSHRGLQPVDVTPTDIDGSVTIVRLVPPHDLQCAYSPEHARVALTWANGAAYASVRVSRDGAQVALLPGSTTAYSDTTPPAGAHTYAVTGLLLNDVSDESACAVYVGRNENVVAVPNEKNDRVYLLDLKGGSTPVQLPANAQPLGVAVHRDGTVWATGYGLNRVFRMAPDGTPLLSRSTGVQPLGVAMTPEGDVLVVCRSAGVLMRLRADGTIVWGGDGRGDSPEDGVLPAVPLAAGAEFVACDPLGNAYVTCASANAIVRVAPDGGTLRIPVSPLGQGVRAIAVDRLGYAFVTVNAPGRLLRISPDGRTVAALKTAFGPQGIAIDGKDRIWITHPVSDTLAVYDRAGTLLDGMTFAQDDEPYGIAIDGNGSGWIACNNAGKVVHVSADLASSKSYALAAGLRAIGDMTGFTVPAVLVPHGDDDADKYLNGEETAVGSNPFDAGSVPADVKPSFVAPVRDLSCRVQLSTVTLTWTNGQTYSSIRVFRAGVPIVLLDRDATTYTEQNLPEGGHHYEVVPIRGAYSAAPASCLATVGANGDALLPYPGENLVDIAMAPGDGGALDLFALAHETQTTRLFRS